MLGLPAHVTPTLMRSNTAAVLDSEYASVSELELQDYEGLTLLYTPTLQGGSRRVQDGDEDEYKPQGNGNMRVGRA